MVISMHERAISDTFCRTILAYSGREFVKSSSALHSRKGSFYCLLFRGVYDVSTPVPFLLRGEDSYKLYEVETSKYESSQCCTSKRHWRMQLFT